MSGSRNRSAWMWVAIAAVAFTSVARAEAGRQNAKTHTLPVLHFLAFAQNQNSAAPSGVLRFGYLGSHRQGNSMSRNAGPAAFVAMLPVLFIGLVSPPTLLSVASIRSHGRPPAAPLLSALFERPPPRLA